jgi:hypothetical protein
VGSYPHASEGAMEKLINQLDLSIDSARPTWNPRRQWEARSIDQVQPSDPGGASRHTQRRRRRS